MLKKLMYAKYMIFRGFTTTKECRTLPQMMKKHVEEQRLAKAISSIPFIGERSEFLAERVVFSIFVFESTQLARGRAQAPIVPIMPILAL